MMVVAWRHLSLLSMLMLEPFGMSLEEILMSPQRLLENFCMQLTPCQARLHHPRAVEHGEFIQESLGELLAAQWQSMT